VVAVAVAVATMTPHKSAAKTAVQAVAVNLPPTNLMTVSALAAQASTDKAFTAAGAAGFGKPHRNLVAAVVARVAKATQQALTIKAVKVESAQKDSPIGRQLRPRAWTVILRAVAAAVPTLQRGLAVSAAVVTAVSRSALQQLQTQAAAVAAVQRVVQASF
jgi:hypothetical protein